MTSRYRASAFSEPSERALGNFHRKGGRGTFARGGLGLRPLRRWAGSRQSRSEMFGGQRRCSTPAATDPRKRTSACMHIVTHARARAHPLCPAASSQGPSLVQPHRPQNWTPSHPAASALGLCSPFAHVRRDLARTLGRSMRRSPHATGVCGARWLTRVLRADGGAAVEVRNRIRIVSRTAGRSAATSA